MVNVGLKEALDAELDRIRAMPIDEARAHAAEGLQKELAAAGAELAEIRSSAIRALRERGYTLRELGELFGLTRARVAQIAGR